MKLTVRLAVCLVLVCCVLSLLLTISISNTNSESVFLTRLLLKRVRYDQNITTTNVETATTMTLLSVIEKLKVDDNGARQRSNGNTTATTKVLNATKLNIPIKRIDGKVAKPLLMNNGPGTYLT